MNQYFEDNQHLKSNRKEFSFRFWCFDYSFISDHGVFSKDELDEGTKVLLETSLKEKLSGKVLDLGCGIGPVGIIVKKEYPDCDVEMVDVNTRALELAKENAKRTNVEVNIHYSDALSDVSCDNYNNILVNPPIRAGKTVIYRMFDESFTHLSHGGNLWVVMRKSHGALSAKKKLEELFGNCEIIKKDKGFYVLKSIKY